MDHRADQETGRTQRTFHQLRFLLAQVLLLSDIHSNLEALEAVLACLDLSTLTETWILGDITGYGPDPGPCIRCVKGLPSPIAIMGNHDQVVAGLRPPVDFNPHAISAAYKNIQRLLPEEVAWLAALPQHRTARPEIGMYHGSPVDPDEYLLTAEAGRAAFHALVETPIRLGLFGHTHVPSLFEFDPDSGAIRDLDPMPGQAFSFDLHGAKRYLLNPGSVGQPRDGNPHAGFAVMTLADERADVRFHRVPYSIVACQRKMEEGQFPDPLVKRLALGF